VKAYEVLREENIIASVHGKGFFIDSEDLNAPRKVFLFMDDMNMYKEKLYKSILENLGDGFIIKLFFHHDDPEVFESVIESEFDKHNYAVIIPLTDEVQSRKVLKKLSGGKIIIADHFIRNLGFSSVHQDFYKGSLTALEACSDELKKYKKFNLLIEEKKNSIIDEIKRAFEEFCDSHKISRACGTDIPARKNEAYWTIPDSLLVRVIKDAKEKGFELGRDIGLMAYNDTPFKELLCGGISIVTTDFEFMGREIARIVLAGAATEPIRKIVPTSMVKRVSL
jgi:DNA-binding LacI/PurR family transcriptional regulator